MYNITIPKPCHENWNIMETIEKGRFCLQCKKTVIDFTKMADADVQNYFIENFQNKICGKFTSQQLNELVLELRPAKLRNNWSIYKRLAYAAFIVFGTTLFSCTNNNGETITKIVIADSTSKEMNKTNDATLGTPAMPAPKGKVKIQDTPIYFPDPGRVRLEPKK